MCVRVCVQVQLLAYNNLFDNYTDATKRAHGLAAIAVFGAVSSSPSFHSAFYSLPLVLLLIFFPLALVLFLLSSFSCLFVTDLAVGVKEYSSLCTHGPDRNKSKRGGLNCEHCFEWVMTGFSQWAMCTQLSTADLKSFRVLPEIVCAGSLLE